ncbi:unnamed protein product [Hermetia illucens]|uniref:superoxide dismutase n=1 Tax=Hermetia illucens TaxID=343691 RepID=A0A7R8YMC1_HERIL|nr:superoxide dismutase [Cu-Zn] isoform X2 [Hermetia illucens]CAD7078393.1 unnamed protein product [Hermetia illucens]
MVPALFVINLLNMHLTSTFCNPTGELLGNSFPPPDVQIIMGTQYTKTEQMVMPLIPGSPQGYLPYPVPTWRASAYLMSESGDETLRGVVLFHQFSPSHFIQVTVNLTGMPPGKHAIHIHSFGDISRGCQSTGTHMPSNFVGNIEAKDDGIVSVIFYSPYLIMFGFNGIVGRSVVIHSNPIDQSRHPAVFSSTIMMVPVNKMPHPSEENILGKPLMCGVITVTNNREK